MTYQKETLAGAGEGIEKEHGRLSGNYNTPARVHCAHCVNYPGHGKWCHLGGNDALKQSVYCARFVPVGGVE